jgi:hypothetical protein
MVRLVFKYSAVRTVCAQMKKVFLEEALDSRDPAIIALVQRDGKSKLRHLLSFRDHGEAPRVKLEYMLPTEPQSKPQASGASRLVNTLQSSSSSETLSGTSSSSTLSSTSSLSEKPLEGAGKKLTTLQSKSTAESLQSTNTPSGNPAQGTSRLSRRTPPSTSFD